MPTPKTPLHVTPDDASASEARMRRALGLQGTPPIHRAQQRPEQARTRHRFVQDGEVPVEVVTGPRAPAATPDGRSAAMHAALDAERSARAGAERSLAEAQATIRSLQAQLAHAELARGEALASERRARERAEAALQDAVTARELAERKLAEASAARAVDAPAARATAKRATPAKSASRAATKTREPQPVKWWLPSHKAKTKGR